MSDKPTDQQQLEQPAKPAPRRYTHAEKAGALVAYETAYDLREAANITGIPYRTIHDFTTRPQHPDVHLMRAEIRQGVLEQTALLRNKILQRALEAIENEKITFAALISGLKVTTEVSQLLSNQPTSIQEQRATQDEIKRQVAEEALQAVMTHKQLDRAAALQYLTEKQPDLARWAA